MINTNKQFKRVVAMVLMLMLVVVGCTPTKQEPVEKPVVDLDEEQLQREFDEAREIKEPEPYKYMAGLDVFFVDVGQGDSTVIAGEEGVVVIDTGVERDAEKVLAALEEADANEIDLLILTHPHADHIGGTEKILREYNVREVVMSSYIATTKVFEGIISELERQDKGITIPEVGYQWKIGNIFVDILGVDTIPKDNNNSSIVCKVSYGDTTMLFTGDLEEAAEKIVIEDQGHNLKADILSVGHHGSETSTSDQFLEMVNPRIGVISVGEGNKYKHPSERVVEKLQKKGVQLFRTDKDGTVRMSLDGENIVIKEAAEVVEAEIRMQPVKEQKGIVTIVGKEIYKVGDIYHEDKECREIKEGQKIEKVIETEIVGEYKKCDKCGE